MVSIASRYTTMAAMIQKLIVDIKSLTFRIPLVCKNIQNIVAYDRDKCKRAGEKNEKIMNDYSKFFPVIDAGGDLPADDVDHQGDGKHAK